MSDKAQQSAASGEKELARRNIRLALLLAGLAFAFFVAFFVVLS